jgi:flagellar assembly protein FliH
MQWSNVFKRVLPPQLVKPYAFETVEKKTEPNPTPVVEGEAVRSENVLESSVEPESLSLPPEESDSWGEEAKEEDKGLKKYQEGFLQGEAKGYETGWAEGRLQGHTEGAAEGEEKGRREGYEGGYAKGFEEGEAKGKTIQEELLTDYENTHQLVLRLIEDLKGFTETMVTEAEEEVLQIAVGIGEKIVRKEIAHDPEQVLTWVQEGLQRLGPAGSAVIHVHPDDLDLLTRRRPELLTAVEGITLLKFEADPKLKPGDCLLEGPDRIIDARIDRQIERIEHKLLPASDPFERRKHGR